jgi:hypothetical protein
MELSLGAYQEQEGSVKGARGHVIGANLGVLDIRGKLVAITPYPLGEGSELSVS